MPLFNYVLQLPLHGYILHLMRIFSESFDKTSICFDISLKSFDKTSICFDISSICFDKLQETKNVLIL